MCVEGVQEVREISALAVQFCWEPKTALKKLNEIFFLKVRGGVET